MSRQSTPYSLEYIILGLLQEKPQHGYDLHKQLDQLEVISLVWRIKQSQLYALLEKLENDDLLTSQMIPGENYPMRKQFQVTQTGQKCLQTWRATPVEHGRDMRQEFLAKLYFAHKAGGEKELLDQQKGVCRNWLNQFEENCARLQPAQQFERLIFQFRISQTSAMLEWLDKAEQEFLS